MNLKEKVSVYIIESPSANDVLIDRKEGLALSEILRLAKIKHQYFNVADLISLKKCLANLTKDAVKIRENFGQIILHFSMHGDQNGLNLKSNEYLSWSEFHDVILQYNETVGYFSFNNGSEIAPLSLSISSCYGFHATKIKQYSDSNVAPYTFLVGPSKSVNWSDSLIAFSVLYHNMINNTTSIEEAVELMNVASGLSDVFHYNFTHQFIKIKNGRK